MRRQIWELFGLWAMALILFVATFIIIRWAVDFASWAALDSGWAQAIGSMAAIVAAFIVGNKQARVALEAIREADEIARKRKSEAIVGIANACIAISTHGDTVFGDEHFDSALLDQWQILAGVKHLNTALAGVPIHELGSYQAVGAVIGLKAAIAGLMDSLVDIEGLLESERAYLMNEKFSGKIRFGGAVIKKWCRRTDSAARNVHAALAD